MSAPAWFFLLLVGGFVWGGFLISVIAMMRAERRKASEGRESGA